MSIIKAFAKEHNIPMTAVITHPSYDEKKGRVTKGASKANKGWKDKGRYEHIRTTQVITADETEETPTAWLLHIKPLRFYVIDIDVKNGKTYKDVIKKDILDDLMQNHPYMVETGSGGMHLYYQYPELAAGESIATKVDCSPLNDAFIREEEQANASVDIITDSILCEGSSYTFDNRTYTYKVIKQGSSIKNVEFHKTSWEGLIKGLCVRSLETAKKVAREAVVENSEILEHIYNIPNDKRNWDEWYKMAQLIYNLLGKEGEPVFMEWSAKSPHHNVREAVQMWKGLNERQNGIKRGMGTLFHLSKMGNPAKYKEIRAKHAEVEESNEWKGKIRAATDRDACEIIYEEVRDRLMYSKGAFYYKPDLVWIQDLEGMKAHLRGLVLTSNLYKPSAKGLPVVYAQNVNAARNIVSAVLDLAVTGQNDDWVQRLFSSSLGYVLFNNGYWDFKKGVFQSLDSAEFDHSICFTEIIPFDFKPIPNEEKMAEIKQKLFLDPFGPAVAAYYLQTLARGLAGDRMKRFLVGIGPSNTGKSMITGALRAACGGYFDGWNGGNLLYRQTNQDEAAQLRWLYLLRTKRIIVSSELRSIGAIDGNIIKRISNGGEDDLKGREHGRNETSFQVCLLPILFAQDLPKIKPMDDAVTNRLRAIPYKMVYSDNPSNALELKKDSSLPEQVLTDEFRQAFLHLLFQAYTKFHTGGRKEDDPEEIQVALNAVVGANANVIDAFQEAFEITDKAEDYLASSVIDQWLTDSHLGVTMTKFGMEMKRHAEVHRLVNVVSKQKKVERRNLQVWTGVRQYKEETAPAAEVAVT